MSYTLIVLPASHYVDRARWALDMAGVKYIESKWPPGLHKFATTAAGGSSVPVLKTPSGNSLTDSSHILQYVHKTYPRAACLYPTDEAHLKEVQDLESLFCKDLGVCTRVIAYYNLFKNDSLCVSLLVQDLETCKSLAFRGIYKVAKSAMTKGMNITQENAADCLIKTQKIFDDVGNMLADGRQYLVANQFTAADIAFATMAAPVLLPEDYPVKLPSLDEVPSEWPKHLRDTPAGQYALRMYKTHRH